MNDNDEYTPNAILIEISIDDEGRLICSGGWSFDEGYPDDAVDFLQDILAGVYALINTQTDNVIAAGKIIRAAPGFDGFEPKDEEFAIEFEPDEELLKTIKKEDRLNLNVIKFDPKKHRKH